MNFIKRIDHYLLVNHPILWRTKVHYFVLFSLILGNVAAFGLGYFPIKWFGALDLGIISMAISGLIIFAVLAWLVSQARNKIRYYRFWDEVLTFAIYVMFTASLLGNLILFERTATHTTARLVSVEQIDIDEELVTDHNEQEGHDFSKPYPLVFPPYDVVVELAERYQLNTSFGEDEIDDKVDEISGKINRIYWTQLNLGMRKSGLICGMEWGGIEMYYFHIFIVLCISMLLFCISHVHLRTVLIVAVIYPILMLLALALMNISTIIPMALYGVLCALVVHGQGRIRRFAILLIIPCTLTFCFGIAILLEYFDIFNYGNSTLFFTISLFLALLVTILSGAYFIKGHFEPTT